MSTIPRTLEPEVMADPAEAREYDAMDHAAPTQAIVRRFRETGVVGRMLDLGAGGGHIAIGVCEAVAGCTIVGVDAAPIMIEMALRRIEAAGLGGRIMLCLADVKELPFAEGEFDAVYSNTTLHHIPDPVVMLREARRVLRPGGVLVIRDLFRPTDEARLTELLDLHAPLSINTPEQRRLLGDSLRAALTPAELRDAAERAGIRDARVEVESDRHMCLMA